MKQRYVKRLLKVIASHLREFSVFIIKLSFIVLTVEKIENQDKIVELLLQNGAEDDLAIFVAANKKGREKALELLIKYGADVNVNRGKNTPLFVADGNIPF